MVMAEPGVAQFCLFLSPTKNITPKVVELIKECFEFGSPANIQEKCVHSIPYVTVTSCCGPDGVCKSKHPEHFLLLTVSRKLLLEFSSSICPHLKNDPLTVEKAVNELSTGQACWMAELALKSFVLDSNSFTELLYCSQSGSKELSFLRSQDQFAPTLLSLERMNFISQVLLCHEREQVHSLWLKHFKNLSLFPNAENLRNYFGDSVGFYFTWMRTYCWFLLGPTIVSFFCRFASIFIRLCGVYVDGSAYVEATSPSQLIVRLFFTLFMVVWALVCTKLWSRQHATLVESWSNNPLIKDLANDSAWLFRSLDQRPSYSGLWRQSRVTGDMEIHFPAAKRRLRYLVSASVIVVCLFIAGMVHIVLLNLEGYITEDTSPVIFFSFIARYSSAGAVFDPNGSGPFPYLPGVLHSLLVFVMNQIIFRSIAQRLTEYENHQSYEDHDRALIIKRFLFEMLDAYGCLAYLGFVLSDVHAVKSLLLTMLASDFIRRFTLECLIPLIFYRLRISRERRAVGKEKKSSDDEPSRKSSIWFDFERELCAENYEPFDDYLEMVLQHGYLVLFAFVCPLFGAPIALVWTFLEAHSDAFKMLLITRRPSPRPLIRGHFIWLILLAAQAWLSILTNLGLLVSFLHAHFADMNINLSLLYILSEHSLFLVAICIHFMVSDIPATVRDARRARAFRRVTLSPNLPAAT